MGWSNYIVCPNLKLMFEISRNVDIMYADLSLDEFSKIQNEDLFETNESVTRLLSNTGSTNPLDVSRSIVFLDRANKFFSEENISTILFYKQMQVYDPATTIISEFEIDEDKEQYKSYKKIMRDYSE